MPKTVPAVGATNWGTPLNAHLNQLMDPTNGGINLVKDDAERASKFWDNGNTSHDDDHGKTIYNEDKGAIQIWKVETTNGTTTRKWSDIQKTVRTTSVTGLGTISTFGSKINGTGTSFTTEVKRGDIIKITRNGEDQFAGVTEVVSNTEMRAAPFGAKAQIAGDSILTTAGTNTVTGTGTQFNTQLGAGDFVIYGGSRFVVASVQSATQFTTEEPIGFSYTSVHAGNIYVIKAVAAGTAYQIQQPLIRYEASDLEAAAQTAMVVNARGGTTLKSLSIVPAERSKVVIDDLVGYSPISAGANLVGSGSNPDFVSNGAQFSIAPYIANGTKMYQVYGVTASTQRAPNDALNSYNPNGGELRGSTALLATTGHVNGLPASAKTLGAAGIGVVLRSGSGSIDNLIGMQIYSDINSVLPTNTYGIYEDLPFANARNWFKNKMSIGGTPEASGTATAMLTVTGNISATGTVTQSDSRLKEDIQAVTGALAKVAQLNGVTYSWKDKEVRGAERQVGLIAQDIEKVVPEAVRKDAEGYMSVNYDGLVGVLVEAIKELKAEVEALKAR